MLLCGNAYADQKTWGDHTVEDALDVGGEATFASSVSVDYIMQIGEDTTYSAFYQDEGDLYSDDGKFYIGSGIQTVAERYGVGLQVREQSLTKTLNYAVDATFTASTATVEKSGQTFVSDGVVNEDFLVVTSASDPLYVGATGEIIDVSQTKIVISMAAAGSDIPSDLTDFDFVVYGHPIASISDNGDIHFQVGVSSDASFKVHVEESNNVHAVHYDVTSSVDGNSALDIEYDADTYSDASAIKIQYDATGFASETTVGAGLNIIIDNSNGSTAGDLHAIDVAVSDSTNEDLEVEALATHGGVGVIAQYLGTPANLASAWKYDLSTTTFTDVTTAFSSAGTDVAMFEEDNDYILLASAATFDEIGVIMEITASHTIIPTFHYIDDAGNWILFSPSDDTSGFDNNGTIRFSSDDLSNWGVRTINEVIGAGAADDYYWIKITRTRNILPTSPTEDTINVTALGTKYHWDKNGEIHASTVTVQPVGNVACDATVKGKIFYDSDDNTFYGCNNAGWQAFH